MKKLIALILLIGLGGCAPTLRFGLGGQTAASVPTTTVAVVPAPPSACPPDMLLDPKPQPKWPAGSEVPKVVDSDPPDMQAGWPIYLGALHDLSAWAKEGWRRAQIGHDYCAGKK